MGTVQHFAYNRTKFAFVSLEVEVAASAPAALDEWFPRLAPRSGSGIWMIPFHGDLPSTGAPSPIDLVYLDEVGAVLEVVQSFPQAGAPDPPSEVASILALPEQSIAQLRIEIADSLVICGGQELELRLKDDSPKKLVAGTDPFEDNFADDPLPGTAPVFTPAPTLEQPPASPPLSSLSPPMQSGKAPKLRINQVDPAEAPAPGPAPPASPGRAPTTFYAKRVSNPVTTRASQPATAQPPADPMSIIAKPDPIPARARWSKTQPPPRTPRIIEIDPDVMARMDLPPPILPSGVIIQPRPTAPPKAKPADPPPVRPVVKPAPRPAELIASKDFALDEETPPTSANGTRPRAVAPDSFPSLDLPGASYDPQSPAKKIAAPQNPPADQALLSAFDRLEARIKAVLEAKAVAAGGRPSLPSTSEPVAPGAYRVIPLEEDNRPYGHYDVTPYMPRTDQNQNPSPQSAGASAASLRRDGPTPQPKWWERALDLDPQDPRRSTREPLDGLASFFWTGGIPKPHPIRDISLTGLYIVTRERWFPGTEIVMTLTKTDGESPIAGHSLSLCTRAVRWGHDGVGLQFLLATPMGRSSAHRHMAANVDLDELNDFLMRLKSAEGQNSPMAAPPKSESQRSAPGMQLTGD